MQKLIPLFLKHDTLYAIIVMSIYGQVAQCASKLSNDMVIILEESTYLMIGIKVCKRYLVSFLNRTTILDMVHV